MEKKEQIAFLQLSRLGLRQFTISNLSGRTLEQYATTPSNVPRLGLWFPPGMMEISKYREILMKTIFGRLRLW